MYCCSVFELFMFLRINVELLSSDSRSVSSPRLSPDGCWLVYLQGQMFGPHNQCLQIILVNTHNHLHSGCGLLKYYITVGQVKINLAFNKKHFRAMCSIVVTVLD